LADETRQPSNLAPADLDDEIAGLWRQVDATRVRVVYSTRRFLVFR
jgi:hypothetical protein